LNLFLETGLWDEIRLFETKGNINKGVKAPNFKATLSSRESLDNTLLSIYRQNNLIDIKV
jgi:diaminohydroxyphosphoribosylaminopyrimidine deaminase/5-amino-6-(5-phosphoribosylamino)uracil reductase